MAKATDTKRDYIVLKVAEDLEGLGRRFYEDLGVESAANPTEARAMARARFPEGKQSGIYVAVALGGFAPKAGGRRQVWIDDETDVDLGPAKPPLHRDADGNLPLAGQTDLAETLEHEPAGEGEPTAGGPKVKDAVPEAAEVPLEPVGQPDATPIPEAEVAVEPVPHVISSEDPALAPAEGASTQQPAIAPPTPEEVEQAKAAREERIRENARRYAEAKAAGDAAQAPDRAAAAAAVAARQESTTQQVAVDLAAKEAERKARVAAEKAAARDEPPAPVNADPDGWGDPAAVGGEF